MAGPLEGFKIIDLCRTRPGQLATGILADYGADVVTIVEPGYAQRRAAGGAVAPEFGAVNLRNKRSLHLNLRAPGALDVFFKVAKDADGLLESNRPGVAKRLGVDYDAVRAVNPGIVYCSLSGFGQYGPYAGIPAHDLSYQAVAGLLPQDDRKQPYVPAYNQADMNASWFGAMALLMGLLGRSQGGQGQFIDVAFCDVSVTIPPGGSADRAMRGYYPAYSVYETKDGRYLALSIREPWFWERVCRLVGKEEWVPHIRPKGDLREEMFRHFRDFFKARTLAESTELLREQDVTFGPVNRTVEELRDDPHLQAREMVLQTLNPLTGEAAYEPGFALKFAGTPASLRRGPTAMGSDTGAILEELGYDDAATRGLRESGAIA